jgi:uncharacterized protein YciI
VSPRYAYLYFMKDNPDRIRATVPSHVRTGGLITFQAEDDVQASRAVDSDPFVLEDLLEAYWLKHWTPQ